jgi:hypothetical protein
MMEEQLREETKPNTPGPARRKRLRWLAVPAAAAVLVLAYHLTRRPELVWWIAPAIGETGRQLRVLIPSGWTAVVSTINTVDKNDPIEVTYRFQPSDTRPSAIRHLFPCMEAAAGLFINVSCAPHGLPAGTRDISRYDENPSYHTAAAIAATQDGYFVSMVQYSRTDLAAFNRTYKQICNSLKIE